MGIMCALSRGLTLGFHTGKGVTLGGASYDTGPSSTGFGHCHLEKVRMNIRSNVDAGASSFFCIIMGVEEEDCYYSIILQQG